MAIIISARITAKNDSKHAVEKSEIEQCFNNRCGLNLIDDREDHQTDPATLWFIAETRTGRLLKIIFIHRDGNIHIKSAYEPNENEIAIYESKGK